MGSSADWRKSRLNTTALFIGCVGCFLMLVSIAIIFMPIFPYFRLGFFLNINAVFLWAARIFVAGLILCLIGRLFEPRDL